MDISSSESKISKNVTMDFVLSREVLVDAKVLLDDCEVDLDLSDYVSNRKHCRSLKKL